MSEAYRAGWRAAWVCGFFMTYKASPEFMAGYNAGLAARASAMANG